MKPSEAIKSLNKMFERFTMVPTKKVKYLIKVVTDENTMLQKDNKMLRSKLKHKNKIISKLEKKK